MCSCVALIHNSLYHPKDDRTVNFDRIDNIITEFPSPSIHICGDFNIHHKKWLIHSNKTNEEGNYYRDFSITYEQTQIIEELIRVLHARGQ